MTSMDKTFDGTANERAILERAGFSPDDATAWCVAHPELRDDFGFDSAASTRFWDLSQRLRAKLPARTARDPEGAAASSLLHRTERNLRERFLDSHVEELYGKLTARGSKFLRVDELMPEAAKLVSGLTPGAEVMAAERTRPLKEKEGLEIDHGILLSHVLAHPEAGRHLCHAMLLARAEALDLLPQLARDGSVDLGAAFVSRAGKASIVELRNPRALNALDETTLAPLETAIDLAILDPGSEVAVLRGGAVEHAKYAGRRIFSAGINLTHLYQGKIPFLFYFQHVMGYENKILRGVARRDASPDDLAASTVEKPWIAAVDTFAIGGGCQHLLVMDYVLADADAYLTLPARKEGIIPGMANLRLPPSSATASPTRPSCTAAGSIAAVSKVGSSATRSLPPIEWTPLLCKSSRISPARELSAPSATAVSSASDRSHSTSSGATWPSTRKSKRTAISVTC
jgi:thioesterase DpgC